MPPRVEMARFRQRLGDVVADEERHEDEIRLKSQGVFSQDRKIFARSYPGYAKVVHFESRLGSLEQRQVIIGERNGGADREGIAESGDAIDPGTFLAPKFRTRIAQAIAAKSASVITSRGKPISVQWLAGQERAAAAECPRT